MTRESDCILDGCAKAQSWQPHIRLAASQQRRIHAQICALQHLPAAVGSGHEQALTCHDRANTCHSLFHYGYWYATQTCSDTLAGFLGFYNGMSTKIVQSILAAALMMAIKEKLTTGTRAVLDRTAQNLDRTVHTIDRTVAEAAGPGAQALRHRAQAIVTAVK